MRAGPSGAATLVAAVALVAASPASAAAPAPGGRTGRVRVEYGAPKDPAHARIAERLRDRKVLETFAEVLAAVRLPHELTLRFAGCDGEPDAFYDPERRSVTFCYELVAELEGAAGGAERYGVSREDAVDGPIAFILLHEAGHALFDLLDVPLLGPEEDAADRFAAYVVLRAGTGVARRTLAGAAWMYKRGASERAPDESDFSDVHGLDAQRLYDVLCTAYGSDAVTFAAVVEKGWLPPERAEGCAEEYARIGDAVKRLISPSLDPRAVKRLRARHQPAWDAPAAPGANTAGGAAPPAGKK